jgi:arylformamidase
MQLSARNQLKGSVKTGAVMAQVVVDVAGNEIVAEITKGSVESAPAQGWRPGHRDHQVHRGHDREVNVEAASPRGSLAGRQALPGARGERREPCVGSQMLIDLSHDVVHGMITYRGLPGPVISDHLSREASRANYQPGTEFQIGRIEMVANTGTYVDAPFHRYPEGRDLAALPLTSVANVAGVVVRAPHARARAVTPDVMRDLEVKGKAVLVHTGWDAHWGTDRYGEGSPYLTEETAALLADRGAILVGIDAHNIDDTAGRARPVHSLLLAREIPIAEHLCNLGALPDDGFRFFAVPVKVRAMGTFPVRAFAIVG